MSGLLSAKPAPTPLSVQEPWRPRFALSARSAPARLTIEVSDDVAEADTAAPTEEAQLLAEAGVDEQGLGALLMEILVDEVKIETSPTGTRVLLTKYAPE